MCGINAAFAYRDTAGEIDPAEIVATRDSMASRGPDGSGLWISDDRRIGIGHRRLSIIDLSERAAQPMKSADGQYVIAFNGEIYNHRELRAVLEKNGVEFRTSSDTEVVVELFRARGAAMLPELRGMFAFCIWDLRDRSLFLARDPYGVKPLYYADCGGVFRLASRVKALLAGGAISRTADPAGLVSFFLRGHVVQPFTTIESVRAVPAGSWMTVDEGGASEAISYFSMSAVLRDAVQRDVRLSMGERRELVAEAVAESVRYHLVSDVPVGAFLSGGRDSTAVVAHAAAMEREPLRTITIAFDEYLGGHNDEAPMAEMVANALGTQHVTRRYTREEFRADLPRFLDAMDQPTVDGINSYIVSKAAAEAGLKVALSGTGGDEMFGGYSTFRKVPRLVRWAGPLSHVPLLPAMIRRLYAAVVPAHPSFSPRSGGLLEYGGTYAGAYLLRRGVFMPWELDRILGRETAREGLKRLGMLEQIEKTIEPDPLTPFARVAAMESSLFMRSQLLSDLDWASMAHSLEVRVPLVDPFLLRSIAPALVGPMHDRKDLLARSAGNTLPDALHGRAKRGFTVPVRAWLEEENAKQAKRSYGMRLWAEKIFDWTLR